MKISKKCLNANSMIDREEPKIIILSGFFVSKLNIAHLWTEDVKFDTKHVAATCRQSQVVSLIVMMIWTGMRDETCQLFDNYLIILWSDNCTIIATLFCDEILVEMMYN